MSYLLGQLPLVLTVVSALAAVIGWGIARVRHNYGLERDINHLKRDYQTLSGNCDRLLTELERRLDAVEKELATLRGINQALIAQRHAED